MPPLGTDLIGSRPVVVVAIYGGINIRIHVVVRLRVAGCTGGCAVRCIRRHFAHVRLRPALRADLHGRVRVVADNQIVGAAGEGRGDGVNLLRLLVGARQHEVVVTGIGSDGDGDDKLLSGREVLVGDEDRNDTGVILFGSLHIQTIGTGKRSAASGLVGGGHRFIAGTGGVVELGVVSVVRVIIIFLQLKRGARKTHARTTVCRLAAAGISVVFEAADRLTS